MPTVRINVEPKVQLSKGYVIIPTAQVQSNKKEETISCFRWEIMTKL